ncbi:MAG: alpha/beta hydrolase, partial [Ketobacteraceae bacterium]|nr:alpha/beta hydrolase [Ketobacteraceae bacterium]
PGLCMFQYFNNKRHSINQLARWLDDFLKAVDAPRVNLVAHSTACCLAIFYASTRPEKIARMTLLSLPDIVRPGNLQDNPVIQDFMKDIDIRSMEDYERYFHKVFYKTPPIPRSYQQHNYRVHVENRERFMKVAREFIPGISTVMTHMQRVRCPVLAVHGDHDPYSSAELAASLNHHFQDLRNVRLERTGHVCFMENQPQVFRMMNEFMMPDHSTATTVA